MKKKNKRQRTLRKRELTPKKPRKAGSLPRELAHSVDLGNRILAVIQKRIVKKLEAAAAAKKELEFGGA